MSDEGIDRAVPARDRSDTALDGVLADTSLGMLAAIQQGLDLDAGLSEIIGAPPLREIPPPEAWAENGEAGPSRRR